MSDLVVKITGDSSGAIKAMADVSGAANDFANNMVAKLAEVTAGVFTFHKALEGLKEGILKADEIRDLTLSLGVFTGSMEKGTEAMRFFEEQAHRTRNTAEELGRVFRDILPLSSSRGLSQSATEDITVMLSQLATVAGTDLSAMESGLQRLMSGGGGGGAARNPLARVLGLNAEDLKDLDFGTLVEKMSSASQHAEEFGQSFESAMHKAKEAWAVAFGQGFNEGLGNTRDAYAELLALVTDPQFLGGIADIGKGFSVAVIAVHDLVAGLHELGNAPPPWMQAITDAVIGAGGSSSTDVLPEANDPRVNSNWRGAKFAKPDFTGTSGTWATPAQQAADAAKNWRDILGDVYDKHVKIADKLRESAGDTNSLTASWADLMGLLGGENTQDPFNTRNADPTMGIIPNLPLRGMPWMTNGMGASIFTPGSTPDPAVKTFADQFLSALNEGFRGDAFRASLSDAFIDLFSAGGKNVGPIFAGALRQNLASELDSLQKKFLPHVDEKTGQLVDSEGNPATTGQKAALAGITGVEIGFAGYQAGYSGTPGARTGSVIAGAASGAALGFELGGEAGPFGAIVGAAIGAIVGIIGGAVGAAQRQADYQYGIPDIGANGIASLTNTKNLTPAAIAQITTQIQQEYDQIHGGLIDLLLKFPNVAIPSFDEITGKFQDNPSAHWGEHLQQWITGTLPKSMITALGDELATGFEQLGMSRQGFGRIFDFLKNIDPQQAIKDMNDLATALSTLFSVLPGQQSSIMQFFHGTMIAPDILGAGSNTFQTGMGQIAAAGRMSPGAQIAGQYDAQILKDAAALNAGGLSPQEQIKYLGEISSLMKQRYDAEKQAIQQIYDVAQGLSRTAEQLISQYTVQGMVGADGKPDYSQITSYYTGKSNQDLLRIRNATNATDVDYWTRQFYQDIGSTTQAGIAGGGSAQDWSKWAATQIQAGTNLANAQLQAIGQTINATNDLLNGKLDPALQKFLDGTTSAGSAAVDVGADLNNLRPPINDVIGDFQNLHAAMSAFLGTMSAAGFAARTAAQRQAA